MSSIYIFSALVVYALLIVWFCISFLSDVDFSFRNQAKPLSVQVKENGVVKVVQMYTIVGILFTASISLVYFFIASALFFILFGVN